MIEIRDSHGNGGSEHQARGYVPRHLVDCASREDISCAKGFDHRSEIKGSREVMTVGIPKVQAYGIASEFLDDGKQASFDLGICLVPLHFHVNAVTFDQGAT